MSARFSGLHDLIFHRRDLITLKFYQVIAIFAAIVLCLIVLDRFQAHVLDAVRSYVAGEGFWSKGQKDATLHLEHYCETFEHKEYQRFLDGLAPSLGDRKARLALQADPPDIERAREGFLQGRNHPDDVDGLISLFLNFAEVSYMKKAIAIWTEGDALIDELMQLGETIDHEIQSSNPDRANIRRLQEDVGKLNDRIGKLEDRFSTTLGDAARWISGLTGKLMFAASLLMLAIATILSRQIVVSIRRTQSELVASEARFRHVIESNMIGIMFWSTNGAITDANDLFLSIIGYSRDELEEGAIDWRKLTPEEFRKQDEQALQEVLDKGFCTSYEKEFVHKEGRRVSVLIGAARIDGSMDSGVCFVLDISERKHAEQAQRLAATVFHAAKEAIFVTDATPRIKAVNPAFLKITGYNEDEVLGKNPNLLSSGRHDADFYKAMWRTLTEEDGWTGEIFNRRKNGQIYQEWLSITALRDEAGNISEYVGVFSDITEIRKMEEQLRQSQKMEAIGTLVGGIAHDFNNTLAALKGNLYLARLATGDNDQVAEKLEAMDVLSDHSAEMVRQLMTFARKDIVQKAPLSLNALLHNHKRLSKSIVPENIEIEMALCSDELWVHGDAAQLQQVLLNLINNACDAVADRAKPRISLTLEYVKTGKALRKKHPILVTDQLAHITLADNGYGMDEEQLAQIFDPFYTTKEVGKGTGLGMSMVYGAVQTHKGAIEIESKAGKGTSVHLYLPLEERVEAMEQTAEAAAEFETAAVGTTVLLVDDNPGIRNVCSETLRSCGHEVLSAGNGVEALELFKANSESIGLVITDILMPKMDGFELAEHIRIIKPEMQIIFMTGYDPQHADIPEPLKRNGTIVTKPFSMDELLQKMEFLMAANRKE